MERLRDYLDKHLGKYIGKYSYKDAWKKDWQDTNKFMISSFCLLALLTTPLVYNKYLNNSSLKKQELKQESVKIGCRIDLNNDGNLDFVLQDIESGKEEHLYRKFIKEDGAWKEMFVSQEYLKRLAEQDKNSKIRKADAEHNKSVEKANQEYNSELKKYGIIEN